MGIDGVGLCVEAEQYKAYLEPGDWDAMRINKCFFIA